MPSADRVPTNNSHSRMPWHMWVVLIAGSTGSALRAVRPPNLHITPDARRDLVYAASATGSLYRSPLAIMAQTIRAILLASAMAATFSRPPQHRVGGRFQCHRVVRVVIRSGYEQEKRRANNTGSCSDGPRHGNRARPISDRPHRLRR